MRGHFAVGYRHVGKREKGEEGSAWLARLGAPRTAEAPCDSCVNPSLPSTCAAPAALNGRPLLFSREEGRREKKVVRGHFAVGVRHVGKREKGEESSAWLARLGAHRTAESPCDPCVNPSLPSTCAAPAALNGRPLLFSREEGRREKKVVRGHFAVGVRHVGKREKGEESSAWLARLGAHRTAESPCDPCVNPSLPSTCAAPAALNGRPLHSVHALPSTLSSLLPTHIGL